MTVADPATPAATPARPEAAPPPESAPEPAPDQPPPATDDDASAPRFPDAPPAPDPQRASEAAPAPDAPRSPEAPRAPDAPKLPALLVALALLQMLTTLLAGWAAWRVSNIANELDHRAPLVASTPKPTPPVPVQHPTPVLHLRPGSLLRGTPVLIQGQSPFGEVAVLLVDGRSVAATLITDQRFSFEEVPLPDGELDLRVRALSRDGTSNESAAVTVRYEAGATPTPFGSRGTPTPELRPTPSPAPTAQVPTLSPLPSRAGLSRPAGTVPRNVLRGTTDRHLALTFDGGSDSNAATPVLDALAARGVQSTLFLTGEFIEANAAIVRRMVSDGHEVGNHTWAHPHLADWQEGRGHVTRREMTREVLLRELDRTREAFEQTSGRKMSRYWRAPYGEVNNEILRWAAEDGWVHVGWTSGLDSLDWVSDPGDRRYRSAQQIRDRLLGAARAGTSAEGGIVLMHLGGERTRDQPVEELPGLIDGLRGLGYRLVTISALLGG